MQELDWLNRIQDFITLFLSIIAEAFPFILLGVCVSIVVGVFIKDDWLRKYIPQNKYISHLLLCFMGFLMPVCECGNIPVARRLLNKGFTVSQSLTFLLAAPILNPITFISTRDAFLIDPLVLYSRMIAGFLIAYLIGIIFSYNKNQEKWINEKFINECNHEHSHDHEPVLKRSANIFIDEFYSVMKMMAIGALFAAFSQTFISREILLSVGTNPVLSILAMIVLSFVISICSNVDAFFALSYYNIFSKGSIVSFLVFGPMIDIKILTMMNGVFTKKLLIYLLVLVFLFSFGTGLLINYLF